MDMHFFFSSSTFGRNPQTWVIGLTRLTTESRISNRLTNWMIKMSAGKCSVGTLKADQKNF